MASSAWAEGAVRVAIDWQGVSDRDIERCGLSRLRAGVIERLVSEGYALVETVDASGVQVAIASSERGLYVHVASNGMDRDAQLEPGEPCDATFVLEVIARVAELVDEVAATRPVVAEPTPIAEPSNAVQAEATTSESRFIGAVDVTGRANHALSWLLGGGLSARAHFASGLELGARAELAGSSHLEVTVLELFGAITAAYQPGDPWLGPYAELGPVVHLASSDARSVTELDMSLGVGLQLGTGHFVAQLLMYARLRDFEHQMHGEIAHDSGRVGLALRFGAQL
jgi:hypothetical protein